MSELDGLRQFLTGILGLGPIENTLIYQDPDTNVYYVREVTPELWSVAAEYLDKHQIN